jgi:sodium transport system permease protein
MRSRIVKVIALKEIKEAFRDRRTLFLMVFLPILMYPLLLLLITQVALIQQEKLEEQTSRVGYLNADADHPLITYLSEDERLDLVWIQGGEGSRSGTDAVVDLQGWEGLQSLEGTVAVPITYESVDEASRQAADRIEALLLAWSAMETRRRLEERGLHESIIRPLELKLNDTSAPEERGGYALGAFLPMLVIATVLIGAYYPAIDLTAGEKERGSIQTLFVAPIGSFEIVAGKYLAVLSIAMVSGMANLLSMALLFSHNLFLSGEMGDFDFSISLSTILVLFFNIVLIALFFSALLLTVAVMARSFKEGQNYLAPVYLVCFIPAIITQLPGIEINEQLALIPAINVTLLMKSVLVGEARIDMMFLVTASTLLFTTLTLIIASKLFAQESVILGERASVGLLTRPAAASKRPTTSEGLAWYAVMVVLLFYGGSVLQVKYAEWGLLATLWLVVLLPTVGFSRFLRLDFRETFALRRPPLRGFLAAVILGVSAWVVVAAANFWIEEHIFSTPARLAEEMAAFFPEPTDLFSWIWLMLLVAVSPAICEEALCRGFLFSSLRDRIAPWALILLTGLLFGVLHLSLYRLFGTTMLGIVLGLLVYKTGSIWTAVIFHALNNGIAALLMFTMPALSATDATIPTSWLLAGVGGVLVGLWLLLTGPTWRAATEP